MTVASATYQVQSARVKHPEALIIGSGPVGIRVGQLLAQSGVSATILGEENHNLYNRVRLTPLLSGDVQFCEIALDTGTDHAAPLDIHTGVQVVEIDRAARVVKTASGAI